MLNFLHNVLVQAEDCLEKLRVKKRAVYYIIFFLSISLPTAFITAIFDKFIEGMEWRTIMKCVLYLVIPLILLFPASIFLILEFKAARAKKIQVSYTGWVFGFAILVSFSYLTFFHKNHRFDGIKSEKEKILANVLAPHMDWDAVNAFRDGDYAYSVAMFEKCQRFHPEDSWDANKPIWFAAKLAINPTLDGMKVFNSDLNSFVFEISHDVKTETGCFTNLETIQAADFRLDEVAHWLPSNERDSINRAIQKTDTIIFNKSVTKTLDTNQ